MLLIALNPHDSLPLTDQIASGLRARILQRAMPPGSRLPSIRRFASLHGVSTATVVEAYGRLVEQGIVVSRQGSGFYIRLKQRSRRVREVSGLEDVQDTLWILRNALQDKRDALQVGAGWLPASWLDNGMLRESLREIANAADTSLFEYGSPHGYRPLRDALCGKLAQIGVKAEREQIITTDGVSQALDLIARHFLGPGDTILVDDPGYYTTFGYLKSIGAHVVGVPRTPDGPDLAALDRLAAEHRPRLFYTMTVLHNPTGTSTELPSAHRILQLAERHSFLIVENDAYGDFHPEMRSRLATLDQLRKVIYVSGFSKTISPDLRVGYVACRAELVEDLLDLKLLTTLTTSQLPERAVCSMLASGGYDELLRSLRARLAMARREVVKKLVASGLELFAPPQAGMFLLARMPHGPAPSEMAELAAQQGIILGPGHIFRPHHEPSPWMRFNVSLCDDPRLYRFLRGVRRSHASEPGAVS